MRSDIFLNRYPSIDLHGFNKDSIRTLVNNFINENIILGNDTIVIIHGVGTGIIRNEVHKVLKENKDVLEYKTDNFNSGATIVKLNLNSRNLKVFEIELNNQISKIEEISSGLKEEKEYLYCVYDKNEMFDEKQIIKMVGDWILNLYKSPKHYAVLDFKNINQEWEDIVEKVLIYFAQLIDYEFDDDSKVKIFKKEKGKLITKGVIKKIDVRYFFGLFRYNIDFEDKNVFVIHAPNGCGKTNLLETINDFFNNNKEEDLNNYEILINRLINNNNVIEHKINLKNKFFDKIEVIIDVNAEENSFTTYRKENSCDLFLDGKSFFITDVGCIYFKDLQYDDDIRVIFLDKFLFNKEALMDIKVNKFNEIMKIFFHFEKTVQLRGNYFKSVIRHSEIINLSKDNIFDIRYKEKNLKNIPDVFEYDQKIDFDILSTGEKNIIRIFFKLIFETRYGSFIILDEPEISLHIEWQSLLVKNIVKLASEYDLKVLMATHSPYIADNPDVIVGRVEDEC